MKSQVLADFVAETSENEKAIGVRYEEGDWILHVDGSSCEGSGVRVILKSLIGESVERAFQLKFKVSNNEVEYEALIVCLRLAKAIGARSLMVASDSQTKSKVNMRRETQR